VIERQRTGDRIFDRTGSVQPPHRRDRLAEGAALARDVSRFSGRLSVPPHLPVGDGHAVLVIPGLLSADCLTRGFRRLLAGLGYQVAGWGAGLNLGPTRSVWCSVEDRLLATARESGKVSLVGHSLGGVLARALAYDHPALVRRVITVCSPIRLPTASRLQPLYTVLRWRIDEEILLSRLAEPPAVPTTAIYSPRDGIVAWSSCMNIPSPDHENVAVDGCHSTMLGNPQAIGVIADRLARP
jgi:hypothetical protein